MGRMSELDAEMQEGEGVGGGNRVAEIPRFMRLTGRNTGKHILINALSIIAVEAEDNGSLVVVLFNGECSGYGCKESLEEIMDALERWPKESPLIYP